MATSLYPGVQSCETENNGGVFPVNCFVDEWLIPVKDLASVSSPSYNHAYILPNNWVYVLSHDGTRWINISQSGEGGVTQIANEYGYLVVTGSGTDSVTINLNEQQIKNLIESEIDIDPVKVQSADGTVDVNYISNNNTYDLSVKTSVNIDDIVSDQRFVDAVTNIINNNINITSSDNSITVQRT